MSEKCIKIDEEVHKSLKVKCAKDGKTISDYVESLIIQELKGGKKK